MIKIFGWIDSLPNGKFEGTAMTEDGKWICGHVMSDPEKIRHFLSVKKEAYDDVCGKANWEYEWVEDAAHVGKLAALDLHHKQRQIKMGLRAACLEKIQEVK